MLAGLAQVATASFLASRAVPTGGFAVALAGGVALARVAQRWGLRHGWGASLAVMLQTVAILGPARISVPLTQAISAPVLGRMEARGHGTVAQALAAATIRVAHHVPVVAFSIWVILGLDAYAASYDAVVARILFFLPEGVTGALLATAATLVLWTIVASTIQALVYRRGLRRWPAQEPAGAPPAARAAPGVAAGSRFDPRAVLLAGTIAFGLLLSTTAWPLLGAVAAWLAVAWAVAGGDRSAVPAGLALTALLAGGALVVGLVGGLALELTLQRAARAALLVLVATWLRYAAGEEGLREVFRRVLARLRRVPVARETALVLDQIGSTRVLAASGGRLAARMRDVPRKPLPLADAVLDWVAGEAHRSHDEVPPAAVPALRARPRDGALVALAAAAGLALVA